MADMLRYGVCASYPKVGRGGKRTYHLVGSSHCGIYVQWRFSEPPVSAWPCLNCFGRAE